MKDIGFKRINLTKQSEQLLKIAVFGGSLASSVNKIFFKLSRLTSFITYSQIGLMGRQYREFVPSGITSADLNQIKTLKNSIFFGFEDFTSAYEIETTLSFISHQTQSYATVKYFILKNPACSEGMIFSWLLYSKFLSMLNDQNSLLSFCRPILKSVIHTFANKFVLSIYNITKERNVVIIVPNKGFITQIEQILLIAFEEQGFQCSIIEQDEKADTVNILNQVVIDNHNTLKPNVIISTNVTLSHDGNFIVTPSLESVIFKQKVLPSTKIEQTDYIDWYNNKNEMRDDNYVYSSFVFNNDNSNCTGTEKCLFFIAVLMFLNGNPSLIEGIKAAIKRNIRKEDEFLPFCMQFFDNKSFLNKPPKPKKIAINSSNLISFISVQSIFEESQNKSLIKDVTSFKIFIFAPNGINLIQLTNYFNKTISQNEMEIEFTCDFCKIKPTEFESINVTFLIVKITPLRNKNIKAITIEIVNNLSILDNIKIFGIELILK